MAPHHILLAATVAMLWGWDMVFAKAALQGFPPFLFATLRFMLVGLVVVPFVPMPMGKQWIRLFELSFVLCTLHFGFLFNGLSTGLDLPTSVITSQLNAPFACILGMIFFRERVSAWRMLGMVIAFTGIIIVVGGTPNVSQYPKGFVLMLLTALSFAVANLIMKRMEGIPHMSMVGWMSIIAAPQLVALSLFFEHNQWNQVMNIDFKVLSVLAYSVLFATVVAYSIWYALLSRYHVSQVVPFGLLVPIIAIIGSQIFLSDALEWPTILGGLVTILGVAFIILPRPHFMRPSPEAITQ